MPKLTSGLTQKERLKVIQSIDIKNAQNAHERQVLLQYRNAVAREFHDVQSLAMIRG